MEGLLIAIDTETFLIGPGCLIPRLVCMSVAWRGDVPDGVYLGEGGLFRELPDGGVVLFDASAARNVASWLLEEPTIVMANAPYDLAVLARSDPSLVDAVFRAVTDGRVSDVQVRERLLLCSRGELATSRVDLESLVTRYLGRAAATRIKATKGPDTWRTRYSELVDVPLRDWPEAAVSYAMDDAVDTLEVHRAQSATTSHVGGYPLVVDGRVVSEDRETRAHLALHLMAAYGMRADPDAVETLIATWEATVASGRTAGELGGWIRKEGRTAGSLDKRVLQAVISRAYGGHPPLTPATRTYPRGQVKTDTETILDSARRVSEVVPPWEGECVQDVEGDSLRTYAESLTQAKALAVWGDALRTAVRGPLTSRPSHLQATGRTAWAQPPLQQPPQKGGLRECFVPRPGYVYCSVDYHVAELCGLAQIHMWMGLGDTMARAINEGRDLHLAVAAELLHTTYHDAVVRYARRDPDAVKARNLAKIANFGFPGGLGAETFVMYARSRGVIVTPLEAKALKTSWMAAWPEMRGYFEWVNRALGHRDSFVYQHPVSGRIRGNVGYTDGCNGPFQGLVADGAKHAAWMLANAAYTGKGHTAAPAFRGSRPVLFLHDEVIAELPDNRAHEAAEAMSAIMVSAMAEHIPDVKIKAEPALMKRWYKAAETVRDEMGQLIPWEPQTRR